MLYQASLPQPFEELDHPADLRIRVRGASAAQTLARLVLAHAALLSGGAPVTSMRQHEITVAGADGLVWVALDVLRELHRCFCLEREIVCRVGVESFSSAGARLVVDVGAYDPSLHVEGHDIKAVTYHAARFEAAGDGYVGEVVFDI
ncbi:MAG: archease [Myxococcota bacterium]